MKNDFTVILEMLERSNTKYKIGLIEGEHSSIDCPSPYPENYSTGVTFSFNNDGSLSSVHSYEPDEDEEQICAICTNLFFGHNAY